MPQQNKWLKFLKRTLATTILAFSSVAAKQAVAGEKNDHPQAPTVAIETAKAQDNKNGISPLDDKLNRLYKNIQGTPVQQEGIKSLLKELAGYDLGAEVIMQAPENVKIVCASKEQFGVVGAVYSSEHKTITLPDVFSSNNTGGLVGNSDNDENPIIARKNLLKYFCHEYWHADQDAKGLFFVRSPYPSQRHVAEKLCELETKLRDICFARELGQINGEVSLYLDECRRYMRNGETMENSSKHALTNIARLYWSNGRDVPEGCKVSSDVLWRIKAWNMAYNKQALAMNYLHNMPRKNRNNMPSVFAMDNARQQAELEANNELKDFFPHITDAPFSIDKPDQFLHQLPDKDNTAPEIIKKYIERLGLQLPVTYFTSTMRDTATIGDTLMVEHYPEGSIQGEYFLYPDKLLYNEYEKGDDINKKGTLSYSSTAAFQVEEKVPAPSSSGQIEHTLKSLQQSPSDDNNSTGKKGGKTNEDAGCQSIYRNALRC